MVDVRLFLRRTFAAGITSSLLAFAVLFGVLVVVPFYFERSLGASTVRTGLELMAMPVALGLVAPWSGRMADRIGVRVPAAAGMGLAAVGLAVLSAWRPSGWVFVALLAVVGAGLGLFNSPNNAGIMASVPPDQSGLASGLLNMSRGLGTAFGLATSTAVFVAMGGDSGHPGQVATAFSVTCAVLAGVAVLTALVAGIGSTSEPLSARSVLLAEPRPGLRHDSLAGGDRELERAKVSARGRRGRPPASV